MQFDKNSLKIDAKRVAEESVDSIRNQTKQVLRKEGAVVGISGGIDSSVVAALCARALGPDKVLGVMMPEKESSPDSRSLAEVLADSIGIKAITENISPVLEAFGCYQKRNEAIKRIFPEFEPHFGAKITLGSNVLESDALNFFKLTIVTPDGQSKSKRMPLKEYLQIVAASNFKQRTRMATLYYHAERLNWAVVGTGNKDEHMLGFFVKYGDGGTDLKPIAHLYKMQIYQLAKELGIPSTIAERTPATDTYSTEVTQTEFFFGIEFELLDLIWYAMEHDIPADVVAKELGLTSVQIERVFKDIRQKQRTTEYLRQIPLEISRP